MIDRLTVDHPTGSVDLFRDRKIDSFDPPHRVKKAIFRQDALLTDIISHIF